MTNPESPGRTPVEQAAEEVAALTALKAGLDDQIAAAKRRMIDAAAGMTKATVATPYGRVLVTRSEEHVEYIPDRFLEWVKEHHPTEVITTESVNPAFARAMLENLTIVRGEVVDKRSGEFVAYAYLTDQGDPYVAYPASREQRDAKEYARMLFQDRALALTKALHEVAALPSTEEAS
jgi:hypothetical protein